MSLGFIFFPFCEQYAKSRRKLVGVAETDGTLKCSVVLFQKKVIDYNIENDVRFINALESKVTLSVL